MSKSNQPRNRYTQQQQQEDRSINQFRERMVDFGWLVDRAERDVGEDLVVRILTSKQPVGLPFYAQLKSVTDLQDRKNDDFLTYRLEADDLLRWENSPMPVVLFVWDVVLREGRWQTVKPLIARLDETAPNWRSQQTVTARIPWINGTNDSGLRSLRAEIGYALYMLISAGRSVNIKFNVALPDTDDVQPDRLQLEKFIREGTPVTIAGNYLLNLEFSEWWAEWFLDPDTEISHVDIIPRPHPDVELVSIMVLSAAGQVSSFPIIELQLMRSGTHSLVLSNAHQNDPVTFTLIIPKRATGNMEGKVTFTINHVGYNIFETREIVRFLQGVAAGGKLTILFRRHGGMPLSMDFQPPSDENPFGEYLDPRYIEIVETLYFVQERLGQEIKLPDGDIDAEDARATYELEAILREGKTVVRASTLSFTVRGLELIKNLYEHHRQSETGTLLKYQQDTENSHVLLFGSEIQVGPMRKTVVGTLAATSQEFEEYIQQNDDEVPFTIRLTNVEITEEFSDWQRKLSEQ